MDGKEVGKGPQLQSYAPQVFLFNKPADYISFFGTNCPSLIEKPGQTPPAGETFFNAKCSVTGNQPYTVVFENFGTYPNLQINFFVDLTAAHEMGHWFDLVILGTPPGQPATAKLFSSSDIWTHEMNVSGQNTKGAKGDYPVFNALQFACSGYDVFNGLKDNHTPSNWICANSGRGPSLNKGPGANYSGSNINVLNAAVPHPPIYLNPAELFAEEAAVDTGDVGTEQTVDSYLKRNAQWYCTQTLVKSMLSYGAPPGTPPSPYPLPSTLPPSEPGAMCPDK
ncbi:MAG: hypothetical protein J2P49_00315 [Methylocapsa sp.]|nr:hypothetical protein [Methylocapsa sp.]